MPPESSHRKQLKAAKQTHLEKQATMAKDSNENVDSLKDHLYEATVKYVMVTCHSIYIYRFFPPEVLSC